MCLWRVIRVWPFFAMSVFGVCSLLARCMCWCLSLFGLWCRVGMGVLVAGCMSEKMHW